MCHVPTQAKNDAPPATPTTPLSSKKYRDEFMRVDHMEPHLKRRYEILRKYPQIKELEGYCPRTRYICTTLILFQLSMAWFLSDKPWYVLVPLTWAISGTINHCLSLAGHELSHGLGFKTQWHNDAFAFFCNVAMGFPSAITFRKYHHLHHLYQGVDHVDTDIPTDMEAKIVLNNKFTKFLFLVLQPAFYALRPQIMYPLRRGMLENVNWAIVATTDFLVWYNWGGKALFYLAIGTLMGLSLHPMAGHFLAEHYVWDPRQETYSYYGPLNFFGWNVGYHVEHHDFPRVPGSRLPKLHEIAKEYYPVNPKYQSWVAVMWNFVWDNSMGSYNRIKRTKEVHYRDRKRILEQNKAAAADDRVAAE